MRVLIFVVLVAVTAVVGAQLYRLWSERGALQGEAQKINNRLESLRSENQNIAADIEYLSNLDNLMKELKALFNYRRPGEKLYIIIPNKETSND